MGPSDVPGRSGASHPRDHSHPAAAAVTGDEHGTSGCDFKA
eukprot:CAMPEP_0179315054 /NCGR_PEP_ID=MMETSP0797-20121207/54841_1 /TAXON_ID=47934 /ORGANISM="Dinophysis acuminata, Strain DAEP01" /LENGTH=40 /DNA_ID= /DNA_START= /DNA_END= /DNA_ORIENTATION=